MAPPEGHPYAEFATASTNGPNGVANRFLAKIRYCQVLIYDQRGGGQRVEGYLVAWDAFHYVIDVLGELELISKGPWMRVRKIGERRDPPDRKMTVGPSLARRERER